MYHSLGFPVTAPVRRLSIALAVLLGTLVFGFRAEAQGLPFALFERYLDSFRVEAGIPGMSATILQNGVVVWERGFGRQDLESAQPTTPDTPYLIGGLSQTFGATMLLRKCIDQSGVDLDDQVVTWMPAHPEPGTTLRDLLSHSAPGGAGFKYAPSRFAAVTGVIERCAEAPYRFALASEIFDRLAMLDSVPDQVLGTPTPEDVALFDAPHLSRYATVLARLATPYRVAGGRPQRNTELVERRLDASDGIVSSVRDLARFDAALGSDILLNPLTRNLAWLQTIVSGVPLPTGLGWFVQNYNGELVVWQFGLIRGGHSALIVKAPNRGLTFILLANSDGLAAPASLEAGDVTTSLFARLFLRFFVP
jgi:CubicO group peptidase (beta-lactamase class C family)